MTLQETEGKGARLQRFLVGFYLCVCFMCSFLLDFARLCKDVLLLITQGK